MIGIERLNTRDLKKERKRVEARIDKLRIISLKLNFPRKEDYLKNGRVLKCKRNQISGSVHSPDNLQLTQPHTERKLLCDLRLFENGMLT